MSEAPLVAVTILNHNGFEHTYECLRSLDQSTYKPLSVIVVDNASTDDSVKKLRNILSAGELIELRVNGGYSHGNNIGIERAFRHGAQYVFTINNDIVIDRYCLEELLKAISNDETIGIIGPKVLYYSKPDTIMNAGITGSIPKARYNWIGLDEKDSGQYEGLIDILYQDGCALLLSKTCYEKIGGFDQRLWSYSEESDLCMRARLAGFRVCCFQKAKVWHKASATMGIKHNRKPYAHYYMVRNSYIYHRRYAGSPLDTMLATSLLLSRTPRYLASILIRGGRARFKNLWMVLAGTSVGLTTNKWQPSDVFAPIKTVKNTFMPLSKKGG